MSLLLDALKNAERAKANSAGESHDEDLTNEVPKGKSFEPRFDPQSLELADDYQMDPLADPSELLSDAALQLEVNDDVVLTVDAEQSDNDIESTSEEQQSNPEESINPESQTESDLQDQITDSSSGEHETTDSPVLGATNSDIPVKPTPDERIDSKEKTNSNRSTVLALEPAAAENARQILSAPNRAGATYKLGLSLGGLLLVFTLGGYFFYTTTMVPDPIAPPQYTESNFDERPAGLAVNAEMTEQSNAAILPEVDKINEKIAPIKPLLESKTVLRQSTVADNTTKAENVNPVASAAANDVEIVANPIKIQKRRLPKSVNALLTQAYSSLQRSDLDAATDFYQKVLRLSPTNVDALLGMGTIKSRQRLSERARGYFEKALIEDPSNVYAQSALSRLNRDKAPLESESQLKSLISQNKRAAHLHFNLANLYAAQSRWVAAESAYYDAYHLDQSKPDYAFNLAISLDHLGKKDMARRFYETALNLAKNAPAQFDKQAAKQRLVQILGS